MNTPQLENGYTKIANEILEHLSKPGINGCEYRILLYIIRKTYGYNKTQDVIALSQFQKGTLMNRSQVVNTIKKLVHKRILVKENSLYKFNKKWHEWLVHKRIQAVTSTQKDTSASTQKDTFTSTQKDTYKRKVKERYKERRAGVPSQDISALIDSFKVVNPSYKTLFGNKTERSCAIRLIEEHGMDKLTTLLEKLPLIVNQPYAPRITTPYELERNLGKLLIFAEQNKNIILKKQSNVI